MKTLKVILVFISIILYSCGNEPKCYEYKKVLKIEPQHSTRVFVTYVSKCNDTIKSTEHHSKTIKCENGVFVLENYLRGYKSYGEIK